MCALIQEELEKVHASEFAKEIWDTLEVTRDETLKVKESRISMLVRKYELFPMEEGETIAQMIGQF